ncbi:conserved virulence factor C family protein [Paludifilum halophilum]|uniref:Virulence factor n=1 Tax=Paludifilum halophilum TaxID=1642702 RepID=A0A235B6Y1_9BACL|nr:conserved virulence factor C family protein [Paludifilum halophilum]OYD08068.1 virulence factor [Paludifilum halophilum]
MKLLSIEPTPSPNSMKLNVDEKVSKGETYTPENSGDAPDPISRLLAVQGVKSAFRVADFIALERNPKVDWQRILPSVREIFGEASASEAEPDGAENGYSPDEAFGEVKVFLQTFRGLPIQIKLDAGGEEKRVPLPERFTEAIMKAQKASDNMVMERKWEERGVRYGDLNEVGEEVAQEIAAAYDQARLDSLVEQAFRQGSDASAPERKKSFSVTPEMLEDSDWKKRYAALEQMNPTLEDLPVLRKAMADDKSSVRRLAVAYLGGLEDKRVLPDLHKALKDPSVTVRRTAGDCLSDLGDPASIDPMKEALRDKSRLVRWRAAMFLYETGDKSAIPALKAAQDDPEFEVSMQVKMALERIEKGAEAGGSVWRQMTRRNQSPAD